MSRSFLRATARLTLALMLVACSAATQRTFVAPTDDTIVTETVEQQGDTPSHAIYVINRSTVPVIVFSVSLRSGPYQGYQLKNLPRFSTQTALSVPVQPNVMLTFAHSSTSSTYLDDENTTTIPGIHLFDVGLRLVARSVEGSIRLENLAVGPATAAVPSA